MLTARPYIRCLVILLAGFVVGSSVRSEVIWGGKVGFDLTAFGFSGVVEAPENSFYANRSLSNHFVDASFSGSLISETFMAYQVRGKVLGAFSQASTQLASNNFYLSPELTSHFASLMVFPDRPYSLRLFQGRQLNRRLEYEPQNRTETTSLQPSLGVVRRYRQEASRQGAVLDVVLTETSSLVLQTGKSEAESLREYDFSEDNDIWVEVTSFLSDPVSETHRIELINALPEDHDSVTVYIDGQSYLLDTNQVLQVVIDSGLHEVLVLPPSARYNQYGFSVRVNGEQSWKILYTEPLSPRDLRSQETSHRGQLSLGKIGKKSLSAFFSRSDRFDPSTRQTTTRDLANNLLEYQLSKTNSLRMETSYSLNDGYTEMIDRRTGREITVPGRATTSIGHKTSFDHAPFRGLAGSFEHEYTHGEVSAKEEPIKTDLNLVRTRLALPFRKLKYRAEVEARISLRSDNIGQATDQYDLQAINRLEKGAVGFIWKPMNTTKYIIRDKVSSDGIASQAKSIEYLFNLDGSSRKPILETEVSLKTNYGYRRQTDEVGSDVKTLYGFDLLLSRRFMPSLKVDVLTAQKWESFGGSAPEAGGENEDQESLAMPTDHKTIYRIDLKIDPTDDIAISTGYAQVKERLSFISDIRLSLSTYIPYVNWPMISSLSQSTRNIGDLPSQTSLKVMTEFKYRYRQLEFSFEYSYAKERLVAEEFSFFEVLATVTRKFGR